jgi:hypothetical protein
MPAPSPVTEHNREASLKISHGPSGQVLTASVPSNITDEEFAALGRQGLGLIRKLTKCNCMSGRISFVVEENFGDAIKVELNPQPLPPKA